VPGRWTLTFPPCGGFPVNAAMGMKLPDSSHLLSPIAADGRLSPLFAGLVDDVLFVYDRA
jgi:hypothetical protein